MRPWEAAALAYAHELLPAPAAQQAVSVAMLCASWEGDATNRDAVLNATRAAVAARLPDEGDQSLDERRLAAEKAFDAQPPMAVVPAFLQDATKDSGAETFGPVPTRPATDEPPAAPFDDVFRPAFDAGPRPTFDDAFAPGFDDVAPAAAFDDVPSPPRRNGAGAVTPPAITAMWGDATAPAASPPRRVPGRLVAGLAAGLLGVVAIAVAILLLGSGSDDVKPAARATAPTVSPPSPPISLTDPSAADGAPLTKEPRALGEKRRANRAKRRQSRPPKRSTTNVAPRARARPPVSSPPRFTPAPQPGPAPRPLTQRPPPAQQPPANEQPPPDEPEPTPPSPEPGRLPPG